MTGERARKHLTLGLVLIGFIALAWAYGLVLPPFEGLDEVEHFSAIRYVAETGSLPVHDPQLQARYRYRQEASQPPLYYILMAGVTRLFGLTMDDTNSYLVHNEFVACGPSDNPYNKHALYHNPAKEAFPWQGALLTLQVLRALTPFLQLATIIGVYAIARLLFPRRPGVAPLAAALTAFNPQFLLIASGVNNDNLVTPLATLGLYLTLVTHQRGLSLGRSIGLGLLLGFAGLSKQSGLFLSGVVGVALLDIAIGARKGRQRGPGQVNEGRWARWRPVLSHGLLIGSVVALICGWWFWRNWQLYRDPTALQPMLDLVGRRELSTLPLNELGLMFQSFWGQIACSFFSDRFYVFFGLLTAVGVIGLLLGLVKRLSSKSRPREEWIRLFLLVLWFIIIFVGWIRWDILTAATGGRLLFPAIASTSTLLAYGWVQLWPQAWRRPVVYGGVTVMALVALATLLWELRPLFATPKSYDDKQAAAISHPLEAHFGQDIALWGYDAEVQGQAPPYLDVTLYWQARAPIPQDYVLTIQLTSPIPGDDSLRFNYNTWPGRGNYPTTAWQSGEIIADHYHFRLPSSDAPTQAWQLLTAFYEIETGQRLPVRQDGQAIGAGLTLTTLRVPGRTPECPAARNLADAVDFGHVIALTDVKLAELPAPALEVSLCWESLAPASQYYTVFVHLYDTDGTLVANGDGPPMGGAFPTGLWQPGDVIVDTHVVSLDGIAWPSSAAVKERYRIGVGLYDPMSGERLQATLAGQALPNHTFLLDLVP